MGILGTSNGALASQMNQHNNDNFKAMNNLLTLQDNHVEEFLLYHGEAFFSAYEKLLEDVIERVDEIITDNPDTALDLLENMIEDFYENRSIDNPDTSLQEIKLKKLIKILVKEWHEQN